MSLSHAFTLIINEHDLLDVMNEREKAWWKNLTSEYRTMVFMDFARHVENGYGDLVTMEFKVMNAKVAVIWEEMDRSEPLVGDTVKVRWGEYEGVVGTLGMRLGDDVSVACADGVVLNLDIEDLDKIS